MKATFVGLILVTLSLLSCSKSTNDEIVIGHISPTSGPNARWGKWETAGIDLAVEQLNNQGGIRGHKIRVDHQDDMGDAKTGVSALHNMIASGVKVVIGATLSGVTLACAPIAEQNKVVLLTPSAQSPLISTAGDYIFRIFPSSTIEARRFSELVPRFNIRKPALIYANSAYGVGLEGALKERLDSAGLKIVSNEAYDEGAVDFRAQLERIKASKPDAVFLLGFPVELSIILRQMKELGMNMTKFAPNSFESEEIIANARGAAEGVYYIYPVLGDSAKTYEVRKAFLSKYGQAMNFYNGVGYDALTILAKAIENSLKAKDSYDGTLVKDALSAIKDFPGVTGPISFDKNGDLADRAMELRVVKNGTFHALEGGNK